MSKNLDQIPMKMLAARQKEPGGPLSIEEMDVPLPKKGEALKDYRQNMSKGKIILKP